MSYQITVQPTSEPITTAEAKAHLRVDFSDDDTYIDTLIVAARKVCEKFCNRAFITQTWRENCNYFPAYLELSMSPVISVTSVKYYDGNEVQQTLSTSNYQVDLLSDTATIYEGISAGFPSVSSATINPIEVIYVCGYGAASDVPDDIKHAIKLMVSHFYENREMINVTLALAVQIEIPNVVKQLLANYRVRHFG